MARLIVPQVELGRGDFGDAVPPAVFGNSFLLVLSRVETSRTMSMNRAEFCVLPTRPRNSLVNSPMVMPPGGIVAAISALVGNLTARLNDVMVSHG